MSKQIRAQVLQQQGRAETAPAGPKSVDWPVIAAGDWAQWQRAKAAAKGGPKILIATSEGGLARHNLTERLCAGWFARGHATCQPLDLRLNRYSRFVSQDELSEAEAIAHGLAWSEYYMRTALAAR
jgi:hypothetical protein